MRHASVAMELDLGQWSVPGRDWPFQLNVVDGGDDA
jgi:hypothetical protein